MNEGLLKTSLPMVATASGTHGRYRAEIDGMRAIAVVAVVLFHFGVLPHGYLGVDIFFVISGYLITGIIRSEIEAGNFSLANFYVRRTRRIIPLSLFISAVALAMCVPVMLPDDLENLAASVVATNLFANNILQAITTRNYWDTVNEFKPLMHTWSLGVEEQYYLLYPLLLLATQRLKRLWLLLLTASLAAISLALYLAPFEPYEKFYYLPFRFFELALGGAIAIALDGGWITGRYLTPLLCLLLAILAFGFPSLGLNIELIVVVSITAAILASESVGNRYADKLLRNRLMVALGVISFSIYMWHQVWLAYARYVFAPQLRWPHLVVIFALSIICSMATYLFIEKPFRDRKKIGTGTLMAACASVFAVGTGASLYIYMQAGVLKDVPELEIRASDATRNMHAKYNDRIYEYDRDFSGSGKIKVLVVGGSFARDWANVLLESPYAAALDISYIYSAETHASLKARIAAADVVFWSDASRHILRSLDIDDVKVWAIGTKNFGLNNGVFYNNRTGDYLGQRTAPERGYLEENLKSSVEWGGRYINLMAKVLDEHQRVPVFTPSGKFISQDCRHFTKAGAQYFAEMFKDDLGLILKRPNGNG